MTINISIKQSAQTLIDILHEYVFSPTNILQKKLCAATYAIHKELKYNDDTIIDIICSKLSQIQELLYEDAKAALQRDPSANSCKEIILCYPGLYALTTYRLANTFYKQGTPFLPRVLSELAHSKTGIDIHPGAKIGRHFFIDHGTGVVIGETTIVKDNVTIYQGVTLGALRLSRSLKNIKRHPTLEEYVTVYSNATILGGDTLIGNHSTIGGNVFITKSVPPYSTVYGLHTIEVKNKKHLHSNKHTNKTR